ncbi:hypothetical protein [Bradyrhizobium guangxiense]|uniref:hypothetical protein n=1 Tax=Bradyrhizobium guangxiense TaxID=1325115 RepID=UPI001008C116|nr:hypothetical protein [Bradyrhizobium guangxiense]
MKAAPFRRHNVERNGAMAPQDLLRDTIAQAVFAMKSAGSASETSSNARARFWFQFVETMIRNHIDERQLNGVE